MIDVTARGEAVGLKKYIEAQRHNAIVSQRLPEFRDLMPLIDQVYARAVRLVQSAGAAAVIQGPMPDVVARALVLCQRDFFAAASLIAQGQPIDAGAMTRRAIETVCWARTFKADPSTYEKWEAADLRIRRYEAWRDGRKPERSPAASAFALAHALVKSLHVEWGLLSEAHAHFTPIHLDHLWRQADDGEVVTAELQDS